MIGLIFFPLAVFAFHFKPTREISACVCVCSSDKISIIQSPHQRWYGTSTSNVTIIDQLNKLLATLYFPQRKKKMSSMPAELLRVPATVRPSHKWMKEIKRRQVDKSGDSNVLCWSGLLCNLPVIVVCQQNSEHTTRWSESIGFGPVSVLLRMQTRHERVHCALADICGRRVK